MNEFLPIIILFLIATGLGALGYVISRALSKNNILLVFILPVVLTIISAYLLITVRLGTGGLEYLGLVLMGIVFGLAAIGNWIGSIVLFIQKKKEMTS
ncbi:MAG: hypothetical protein ACNA7U_03010 [Candidatus Izemoplasmataceae bacterium]|uniref:hypothetical protein n=1 Tax=Liberiplasma polymorphum TaxID=3374570 RepID=UPI0037735A7E